jgi:hypothetical protein
MGGPYIWEQDIDELTEAWSYIPPYRTYLEIGACFGGTMATLGWFAELWRVAVDLPKQDPRKRKAMSETFIEVCAGMDELTKIEGDSTDPMIVKEAGGQYDLVFIDGGHSYEVVKKDWLNYGPMGKVVMFHDTHNQSGKCLGVKQLFEEIEDKVKIEIIGKYGIGIVV